MPSPFPGMNPYLENSAYWSGVHHWLINAIARTLTSQLRPRYVVAVEVRTYQTIDEESLLVGIPDNVVLQRSQETRDRASTVVATPSVQPIPVTLPIPIEIRQGYLEVRRVGNGEVVTAIEVLSPINKRKGEGRRKYEEKRHKILGSLTNLVEIDLLRQGQPLPMSGDSIAHDYRILVSRVSDRPRADLYGFNLRDSIPIFPIPLCDRIDSSETEPTLNLKQILDEIYDLGGYDLMVDYSLSLTPALSESDRNWANEILRS
jgi:hypothetical protein